MLISLTLSVLRMTCTSHNVNALITQMQSLHRKTTPKLCCMCWKQVEYLCIKCILFTQNYTTSFYSIYMNLVALCPWKPQHPAVLTGPQTAVRDRWLQVVVSRDREHSFGVFWDLTGMNWPGSYGRFCCQMRARLLQQIHLYSKSKLEAEREKGFSFYMSFGFSIKASGAVWAKPVKWGQGGIAILNNNIKAAWNISSF